MKYCSKLSNNCIVLDDETIHLTSFQAKEKRNLYILDCLFSAAVIGTLVVSAWRGGFQLLDLLVYPENRLKSYWVTLVCILFKHPMSKSTNNNKVEKT